MSRSGALPDFVLVRGAYGDETTWAKIVPLLAAAGAGVTTLTLPAHSAADNALAGRTTLADYVQTVGDIVAAAERPVVLAGHSMARMVTRRPIRKADSARSRGPMRNSVSSR